MPHIQGPALEAQVRPGEHSALVPFLCNRQSKHTMLLLRSICCPNDEVIFVVSCISTPPEAETCACGGLKHIAQHPESHSYPVRSDRPPTQLTFSCHTSGHFSVLGSRPCCAYSAAFHVRVHPRVAAAWRSRPGDVQPRSLKCTL